MIHPLGAELRTYAWGSATALPELLGVPATGEPVAEAWFGAHPAAPSPVTTEAGTTSLDRLVAGDPAGVLGPPVASGFDGKLPFLVKLLAAARPLSIQAHPSAEQAAAGFAREEAAGIPRDAPERTYRDPHAKPEVILALTPFEMLYGLREPTLTARLIDRLVVPELAKVAGRLHQGDAAALGEVAAEFAAWPADERSEVTRALAVGCEQRPDPDHPGACRAVAALAQQFPGDIGVLFALLMNHARLSPLEAAFLPARTLHAYLSGTGLEVMGNSDNVVRAGLTAKHVALDELLDVVDFSPRPCVPLDAVPSPDDTTAGQMVGYGAPAGEFDLHVLTVAGDAVDVDVSGPEVLVALEGTFWVSSGERTERVEQGGALFVAGTAGRYRALGRGRLARASVPT